MDCLKCCSQAFSPQKHLTKPVTSSVSPGNDSTPAVQNYNGLYHTDEPMINGQDPPSNKIQGFIDVLKYRYL